MTYNEIILLFAALFLGADLVRRTIFTYHAKDSVLRVASVMGGLGVVAVIVGLLRILFQGM